MNTTLSRILRYALILGVGALVLSLLFNQSHAAGSAARRFIPYAATTANKAVNNQSAATSSAMTSSATSASAAKSTISSPVAYTETSSGALEGDTLLMPVTDTAIRLVDMNGKEVHSWNIGGHPGLAAYLLGDGNLLTTYSVSSPVFSRRGVNGGGIALYSWSGTKLWSYVLNDGTYHANHDVAYMDNGDILTIAYEFVPKEKALSLGFPSSYVDTNNRVWSEAIFEIDPTTSKIIWQWHAIDHLLAPGESASAHPELIDPSYVRNTSSPDWLHANDIDYNEATDQIILSLRNTGEFWIIDHHTTTSQAAGSAGDLLYRYGNPATYGGSGQETLFGQHDVHWIDPHSATSHILLFNNGNAHRRPYSTADELSVSQPYLYGKASIVWSYGHNVGDKSFFSDHLGSAQRLANGDTLICVGTQGYVFEVNPQRKVVWQYTSPYGRKTRRGTNTALFRATRYPTSYPGLKF